MRLLEFFNEAQEVNLKNPGTLQNVLDAFLSYAADRGNDLPEELHSAEARCAVLRTRLDQSKEAGHDAYDQSSGVYGVLTLDAEDMAAVATALKVSGTPEDAEKLKADLQGMRMEGISGRGSEPTAKGAQGFEITNQGVTRRQPGEGPGVNGGRSQSQQFDSYDQPQYKAEAVGDEYDFTQDNPFISHAMGLDANRQRSPTLRPDKPVQITTQPQGGFDFMKDNDELIKMLGLSNEDSQIQPAKGWEVQDPHQGSQEAGPILQHEEIGIGDGVFGRGKMLIINPDEVSIKDLLKTIHPASSLFWKLCQVKGDGVHGVRLNSSEVEELRYSLIPRSHEHQFDDIIQQLHEAKIPGGQLDWEEKYKGAQWEAKTEFGTYSVHQANRKWCHVFYPEDGIRVNYEDGYAPSPEHAMQECEAQYKRLAKRMSEPEGTPDGHAGASATSSMGSVWQERKPLMNSRDRADEIKDVPNRMKNVFAQMDKLKKSSEKEKKEHPWASKKIATRIAQDHMKKEGVSRLMEFFALNEGRAFCYTFEPEANGIGRVLSWEMGGGSLYPISKDPMATGPIEDLVAAVCKEEPMAQEYADEITQNFEEAVSEGGMMVIFTPEGGARPVSLAIKHGTEEK